MKASRASHRPQRVADSVEESVDPAGADGGPAAARRRVKVADVTPPSVGRLDGAALTRVRAALHLHHRRDLAHLDLHALVADDLTDAAFDLEELFWPLDAVEVDELGAPAPAGRPLTVGGAGEGEPSAPDGSVRLQAAPAPLLALLERPRARPALIIGAPGAGKSCFLRWCAITGARDPRFLGIDRALPVHLELPTVRGPVAGRTLADLAFAGLRAAGLDDRAAIEAEAAAGRVVFLLDGLDETDVDVPAMAAAIDALARTYPRARVIVTTRPAALDQVALVADRFQLEGLSDQAIEGLLRRWGARLGRARPGTPSAGPRLAAAVLTSPALHDLAANPLFATFLALLHDHAPDVALPEQRVTLCQRVLERALAGEHRTAPAPAAPRDVAAVIAALGPTAFAAIATGRDGAVAATPLLAGVAHRTMIELLAAHHAVGTGALEDLLAGPDACAAPWHEVVRLALGLIGAVRRDEDRLTAAIALLIDRARAARAAPTALVPALLGSILVDDPGLTPALAAALCAELVPAWWFDGASTIHGEVTSLALADRILEGRWRRELAMAFVTRYRPGWGDAPVGSAGLRPRMGPMGLLRRLGCSVPLLLCEALVAQMVTAGDGPAPSGRFTPLALITPPEGGSPWSFVKFALRTSGLSALLRRGTGRLFFATMASDSEVAAPWIVLEDPVGTRMIGRRLDHPRDDAAIELSGGLHIAVAEHPDRALLPNVLAAWHDLARRYPDGPRPPASIADAVARYGAIDVN